MRRLLVLASTMVFFDVAFYSAIAPLLPHYVSEFGLSEAEAGILQGSYAAGTLLAALPAGMLVARIGPRATVLGGLVLFGLSGLAFGFGNSVVLLVAARFTQGAGGAMIWSGSFAWLIAEYPPDRRGAVIGTVVGTAVAGALFGPLLGGVAAHVGTEAVFGAVALVAVALAIAAARTPEVGVSDVQNLRDALAAITSRPIVIATGFVAAPSLMAGAIEVLVPLRIDDLGGSATVIAAGFVVAAAIEAALAPIAGRYSDRAGRRIPFVGGILVLRGRDGRARHRPVDRRRLRRPLRHRLRLRALVHAGDHPALGGGGSGAAARGICRRALEHRLGVRPGDRGAGRRRPRQRRRLRGAESRRRRGPWPPPRSTRAGCWALDTLRR